MKKSYERSASIQQVFVILVLGMFMVFSVLMVVLGAVCYCELEDKSNQVSNARILQSFVRSTLRNQEEGVRVRTEGPLLIFEMEFDGEVYGQYIYAYDGQLRQQFPDDEFQYTSSDGEARGEIICPARLFQPRLEGNLLIIEMQDENGQVYTLYENVQTLIREGGAV